MGSELATTPIIFTNSVQTGATDGKNIYLNPEYYANVDDDVRLYLLAHEILHNKFMHMFRLKEKNGQPRDMDLWNIVCDALVNANLKCDGIHIPDGRICSDTDNEYGDWVLQYNCEELYELKKRQKEEQDKNNNQAQSDKKEQGEQQENQEKNQEQGQGEQQENQEKNQGQEEGEQQEGQEKNQEQGQGEQQKGQENNQEQGQGEQQEGQGNNQKQEKVKGKNSQTLDGKSGGDDHSLWEEAFASLTKQTQEKESKQQKEDDGEQTKEREEPQEVDIDERKEFESYRQEKIARFEAMRQQTLQKIRENPEEDYNLENIGESTEPIAWQTLLRREIEKEETMWSQRRSIAENNYAYRLIENDIEDGAETQVMIDVSGSVNVELVKAFLRQTKSILKHSKLKVGCFAVRASEFKEINNVRDIENFRIPIECGSNGTNLDLAARSFTIKNGKRIRNKKVNKIVFTDGEPFPADRMPKEDLKGEDIIWLVYGNKNFNPCCGKVIQITEKQLEQLYVASTKTVGESLAR